MKTRIFAMLMTLCLAFSFSVPAFAAKDTSISEAEVQEEIEETVDARMDSVFDQFDGLPDSYMRAYRQIVYAQVEQEVSEKYGLDMTDSSIQPYSPTIYSLPNGGIVYYSVYEATSGDTFDVAVTCLERQRAYNFLLETLSSFKVKDLCIAILGYVPVLGPAFSTLSNIKSVVTASVVSKIKAAGGYAQITNMSIRVGNQPGQMGTSVVEGWTTHTRYTAPSNATNRSVVFFPVYQEK